MISGSRYDLINDNHPLAGAATAPPGRNLYPAGLNRGRIEDYVKQHPAGKDQIYTGYTVVRRKGTGLTGIPYSSEYRPFIERGAVARRAAADLSGDPGFAKFLKMRAGALRSDDLQPGARFVTAIHTSVEAGTKRPS